MVCCHIHHRGAREINGVRYANDGDWVEHRTALAEDSEGKLHLLGYSRSGVDPEPLSGGTVSRKLAAQLAGRSAPCKLGRRSPPSRLESMGKPDNTGLRRILNAARFSAQGFGHAWKHEAAFRQELGITIVLVPFALWLGQSPTERLLLIGSCVLVLVVELLNSAVEAVVDRFGGEHHELSGRAKDMGSAAVFVSLSLVLATWITIGWQRFA